MSTTTPAAVIALIALAACEGPFVPPPPYPPPPAIPASVTVTPDSATVITDDTLRLNAIVRDSAGHVLTGVAIGWASADTTIVRLTNALGTVRGLRPGVSRIRAFAGAIEGSVTVFVTPLVYNGFAAGSNHVCAVANNRRAYCWGENLDGEIGLGMTSFVVPVPHAVMLDSVVVRVLAGGGHSCALTATGAAYCWGRALFGQLGRGATPGIPVIPTLVATTRQFAAAAGGANHTCGLATDGRIACWGANSSGQVGDNATDNRFDPRPVVGDASWLAVSLGANHTCALGADHTAQCWGANDQGQLGDSTLTQRHVPTPVFGGQAFAVIAAGGAHSCAVTAGGAAYCWGRNKSGQTGSGLPDSAVMLPTPVAGGLTFRSVTTGAIHSCGIAADSTAYCWGNNTYGQLGDSSQTDRPTPVAVYGGLHFEALSAGAGFTCGLTGGLLLYCWGDGTSGQLGRPQLDASTIPVRVAGQ